MISISITGLDGCGKTTQAKMLANILPHSRIVSVWDIIKRKEFQSWTIYQNPPNVEKYVYHLDAFSRSLFVFHAFNEAYQKAMLSDADYLIFDGHWYKYWAIEQAMGAPASFQNILKNTYAEPDYSFYIQLPIDELLKRKKEISVYEGGVVETEKWLIFKQIQQQALPILESILPENTIVLNGLLSPVEKHLQIKKVVEK